MVEELWLDHDLGYSFLDGEEDTIWPVVLWLEEQGHLGDPFQVRHIFVHTANPVGADRMIAALSPYYKVARAELPQEDR